MIVIDTRVESTPTVLLSRAMTQYRGELVALKWDMVLRIVPRATDEGAPKLTSDAWYDAVWSIPAVCNHPDGKLDNCPDWLGPEEEWRHVGWYDVAGAGTVGVPPVIPVITRLAATPEITDADVDALEQRQPGVIANFFGDRVKAREWLEGARAYDMHHDMSANVFHWDEQARRIVALYRSLTPPKLDRVDRVISAGARLLRAQQELAAATESVHALVRNAVENGATADWARWTGLDLTS